MTARQRLTEAQRRALAYLAKRGTYTSPSMVGQAIMEGREHRQNRSAQGYGRIGGRVIARLLKRGFVSASPNGWAFYQISFAGRAALSANDAEGR